MKRTTAPGSAGGLYKEAPLPATRITAEDRNNLQEEVCNVIEGAGLALDGGVQNQLLLAIQALIAAKTRFFKDEFDAGPGPWSLTHAPSGSFVLVTFDGWEQPDTYYSIVGDQLSLAGGADPTTFQKIRVRYAY